MKRIDPELLKRQDAPAVEPPREKSFASAIENSPLFTLALVGMGVAYETNVVLTRGFTLDINGMIFIALMLGLLFHWRPIRYIRAFNRAARTVGPILLQFPLYGGIMGMMTGTGLAAVIAQAFVAFSTHQTLPFWSFVSSNIISLFVPSGGGHWAVQGPIAVDSALALGQRSPAYLGLISMAVAVGEGVANMIQPFWLLPLLAIAKLNVRQVMGFTIVAFVIGLMVLGATTLIAPHVI